MNETTVQAGAEAQKGFLGRVVGVFFSPSETFEDVRRRPTILLPMIVLFVLMAVIFYVIFPAQVADNAVRVEKNPAFQSLSEEQREQQVAFMTGGIARMASAVGGPAAILVFTLFFALLYWGLGHLLGGEPTYKAVLSMLLFIGMLNPVAHFAVKAPLMLAKKTMIGVTFGPAMFLPDLEITSMTFTALALLDLFNIWGVVVTGIGIARVARISTALGMTLSILLFAVGAGIQLGFTAAFS
jgi:hypothetical protein